MNRKVMCVTPVVFLLIILLLFVLTACGGNGAENPSKDPVSSLGSSNVESTGGKDEDPIITPGDGVTSRRPEQNTGSSVKPNGSSKPAESKPAESNSTASKPTESNPAESKPTASKPAESEPTGSKPTESSAGTSSAEETLPEVDPEEYEEFLKKSPKEQQKYMESFSDIDAFFAWYNAAKDAYEKANPSIEAGDGSINIGDIIEEKD